MKCLSCGVQIPDDAKVCPSCGASVDRPASDVPQPPECTQDDFPPAPPSQYVGEDASQSAQPVRPEHVEATTVGSPRPQSGNSPKAADNNIGTAGFVIAIVALFIEWIPVVGNVLGTLLWVIGAVLSIIGLTREPRGLAIAGTVISFIGLIMLVGFIGCVGCAGTLIALS